MQKEGQEDRRDLNELEGAPHLFQGLTVFLDFLLIVGSNPGLPGNLKEVWVLHMAFQDNIGLI